MKHDLFLSGITIFLIVKGVHISVSNDELDIEVFGEGNILQYFKKELEFTLNQVSDTNSYSVCYNNSKNYNARVRFNGNIKQLEINIGVVMAIYHLSYLLMMNDMFFPDIGDAENTEGMNFFDFELPAIEMRKDKLKEINFYSGPSDSIRQSIAQVIAMFGVEFIIFHELGHILGGHLDYLKDNLGITELKAQGSENDLFTKTNDFVTYQTIEMDADAISMYLLLENALCKKNYIISIFLDNFEIELGKLLIISVVIAFFLMNTGSNKNSPSSRYLPRDYRFHLVLSILLSKLQREYKTLLYDSTVITDAVKMYLDCNEFLSKLFNTNKMVEIPPFELDQYYYNVILKKWQLIKEDVQKKAKIKLPD